MRRTVCACLSACAFESACVDCQHPHCLVTDKETAATIRTCLPRPQSESPPSLPLPSPPLLSPPPIQPLSHWQSSGKPHRLRTFPGQDTPLPAFLLHRDWNQTSLFLISPQISVLRGTSPDLRVGLAHSVPSASLREQVWMWPSCLPLHSCQLVVIV